MTVILGVKTFLLNHSETLCHKGQNRIVKHILVVTKDGPHAPLPVQVTAMCPFSHIKQQQIEANKNQIFYLNGSSCLVYSLAWLTPPGSGGWNAGKIVRSLVWSPWHLQGRAIVPHWASSDGGIVSGDSQE